MSWRGHVRYIWVRTPLGSWRYCWLILRNRLRKAGHSWGGRGAWGQEEFCLLFRSRSTYFSAFMCSMPDNAQLRFSAWNGFLIGNSGFFFLCCFLQGTFKTFVFLNKSYSFLLRTRLAEETHTVYTVPSVSLSTLCFN
jgi:hypothetical protein